MIGTNDFEVQFFDNSSLFETLQDQVLMMTTLAKVIKKDNERRLDF